MSKKIVLAITPSKKITIDFAELDLRSEINAKIFDIAALLGKLIFMAFILFIFPALLIRNEEQGLGFILWLYVGVVILLALQLIKKILGKGDYLPTIPYDILFLSFTAVVAVSLFYTISKLDIYNIWGGEALKGISGVSIICYWFIYYFVFIYANTLSNGVQKIIKLLAISAILGSLANLFLGNALDSQLIVPFIALMPGWLTLFFTQKNNKLIYLINILLGFTALVNQKNNFTMSLTLFGFLVIISTLLLKNRGQLKLLYKGFDKSVEKLVAKKYSWREFINENSQVLLLAFSALIAIIIFCWIVLKGQEDIALGILQIKEIFAGASILNILLGNGLAVVADSMLVQFIYSYGILPTLLLLAILFMIIRETVKLLKTSTKEDYGLALFFLVSLLGIVFINTISFAYELGILLFWIVAALVVAYKFKQNKQILDTSDAINELKVVKNKELRKSLLRLVPILPIVVILVSIYIILMIIDITPFLAS